MLTPDEELQERSGVSDVHPPCRNCGESWSNHSSTNQCLIGYVNDYSQTSHYEPEDASDILSAENEGL
jgi:hypothetical protein